MALLQISEPGQTPEPHSQKRAAGIDLGTTNSLVATVKNQQAAVIADAAGQPILPSVVHYAEGDEVLLGTAALQYAERDPDNTLQSFKRWMGRSYADVKDSRRTRFDSSEALASVETRAGSINAMQASAKILGELAARAESFLGGPLSGAVITVPAYFDDAQRQATRDAATLAGLEVLRLVNEPTAAALAYGIDKQDDRHVAIYDLGGGTFDISILQLSDGIFEVLATGGDAELGGDDFDQAIVDWVLAEAAVDAAALDAGQRALLYQEARAAKHALGEQQSVQLQLDSNGQHWSGELSRADFARLIDPMISQTLEACQRCLDDADLELDDIADVVMVGGSTRVGQVRERVAALFGDKLRTDVDPDQVVAIGAAMQADILVGNKQSSEMLLLDVLPLSLGIETMGGLVEKIIPRNSSIPCAKAQEFTTQKDGQTALAIHVLQGERDRVQDCRSLARFELRGIPPMVAGAARIQVSFAIDASGMLSVSATETISEVSAQISVQPSSGLAEEDIERMLKASYQNAREDRDARALLEQQVEADSLLEAVEAALDADAGLLDVDELAAIQHALDQLREQRMGSDADGIKLALQQLNAATELFAARRMDKSIKQALTGRSLGDFASADGD